MMETHLKTPFVKRLVSKRSPCVYVFVITCTTLALAFLAGCAANVKTQAYHPKTNVYVPPPPEGEVPKAPSEMQSTMIASWYGMDFNGKLTASGEIYNMYAYSAAHKHLPFGTMMKVTNPSTGLSVNIVVNDRGPYVEGRDLDLSYQAAKEIGLVRYGVGLINVEYLGRDTKYVKYIRVSDKVARGLYTIQIASFEEEYNAGRMKKALELEYQGVYIASAKVKGKTFYRVRVGKFGGKQQAVELAKKLANEGYDTYVTGEEG